MMRWRGKTGNAKRKYCWVVGQTKGTKVRSVGARHHWEIFSPYIIWVIFSLFIYRAGKTKRKGRMGKERGQTEGKAPSALFGEARNPTGNPSGWSRDGFGMESPIRTAAFPTPNCPFHANWPQKWGKNEVNFIFWASYKHVFPQKRKNPNAFTYLCPPKGR